MVWGQSIWINYSPKWKNYIEISTRINFWVSKLDFELSVGKIIHVLALFHKWAPKWGPGPPGGSFLKIYQFSWIVAHYLCRKVSQYEYGSFIHIICTSRTIFLKISKNLIMCAFLGILRFRLPGQLFFWPGCSISCIQSSHKVWNWSGKLSRSNWSRLWWFIS